MIQFVGLDIHFLLFGDSDRPEKDPADDSALLFGRTSCRSRRKNNYKILLLTGAQDLLFEKDLLPEQELHIEQEDLLIIMWGYILHEFLSNTSQTALK